MTVVPGYWMCETSGVLKPAIERLVLDEPLQAGDIAALRAYFRQWIAAEWRGDNVVSLRAAIDGLTSREAIQDWLDRAFAEGIDPL